MSGALNVTWGAVFGNSLVCAPRDVSDGHGDEDGFAHRWIEEGAKDVASSSKPPIAGVPVAELLRQIREDRQEAIETLYTALHEPLWHLAMILVRSRDTAEEIVQTVFVMLWARRKVFHPDTDIHAYLRTAVRNEARQLGRHARVVGDVADAVHRQVRDTPGIGQAPVAPDEAVETSEFWEAYRLALATLTERERIALQLRLEDEESFDEIGRVLGVSNVGARKIVMRAEEKARQLLLGHRI